MSAKMHGTVGTVGTLARFLGEYARFSRVPKSANGTLDGGRRSEIGEKCKCKMKKRTGTLIDADRR